MAASPGWEGPPPGSPPTLSGSKTVFFENIGTFCRKRRLRPNPSAAFPCWATHSRSDNPLLDCPEAVQHPFYQTKEISSHDFTRCFECKVCDLRGERKYRLGSRRFS